MMHIKHKRRLVENGIKSERMDCWIHEEINLRNIENKKKNKKNETTR